MTLSDLQREIAALPSLAVEEGTKSNKLGDGSAAGLQVVAKQGRLLLRMGAAIEALEASGKETTARLHELSEQTSALTDSKREAERRVRQIALEAIRLLDALDWVQNATKSKTVAAEVEAARRDGLRRLAAVGITPIPCDGPADGRLHETVETRPVSEVPQYHIVSVARPGYQYGPEVCVPRLL